MELNKVLKFKIYDKYCTFRSINETDVNKDYIDGLKEQTKYIENIPTNINISKQKKYVQHIINSNNDTICGLFLNEELVGTAGIQLSFSESFLNEIDNHVDTMATIGIFVFNKKYRGKGLGKVFVWASTYLFHHCTDTILYGAGMEKDNLPSYKSFLSCGYHEISSNEKYYKVKIKFSNLLRPNNIRKVEIN